MAHGSKKWITNYEGRLKRSRDRTKKDKYSGLDKFDDYHYRFRRYRAHRWYNTPEESETFCPQCKHIQKPLLEEERAYRVEREAIEAEYDRMYGDAARQWDEYHRGQKDILEMDHLGKLHYKRVMFPPKVAEPPNKWQWVNKRVRGHWWQYDARSYLCYKHERMYEVKWSDEYFRDNYGGRYTSGQTHARRAEYRMYRNDIRNIMQRAKYDDDYYEEIYDKKNGWLD